MEHVLGAVPEFLLYFSVGSLWILPFDLFVRLTDCNESCEMMLRLGVAAIRYIGALMRKIACSGTSEW